MRVCPTCGAENDADARFCGVCGSRLPPNAAAAARGIQARQPSKNEPPAPRPRSADGQPQSAGIGSGTNGVAATVEPASISVEPGGNARAQIRVVNLSRVVDEYRIEVLGEPGTWTSIEPKTISLFPGATGTVELQFRPPRTVQARAGTLPLTIRVRSVADAAKEVYAQSLIRVGAFEAITVELVPRTSSGKQTARHELTITNQGNSLVQLDIRASDPDRKLTFTIPQPSVAVEAGRQMVVPIQVSAAKRFWRGSPVTLPFQVSLNLGGGNRITADASLAQQPVLPSWTDRAVAAAAAVIGALILAVTVGPLRPSDPAATPSGAPPSVTAAGNAPVSAAITPTLTQAPTPVTPTRVAVVTSAPAPITTTAAPVSLSATVQIPAVRGKTESAARSVIVKAGLTVGFHWEAFDAEVATGRVVRTDLPVGDEVPRGTAVEYVVSLGPPAPAPPGLACDGRPAEGLILQLSKMHPDYTVPADTLACLGRIAFDPPGSGGGVRVPGVLRVTSESGLESKVSATDAFDQPGIVGAPTGDAAVAPGQSIRWTQECACDGYVATIDLVLLPGDGVNPAVLKRDQQALTVGALQLDDGLPDVAFDGSFLTSSLGGPVVDIGYGPGGYADCWSHLRTTLSAPVPADRLVAGTHICVRTDGGSIADLRIEGTAPNPSFSWQTYGIGGAIPTPSPTPPPTPGPIPTPSPIPTPPPT